MMEVTRYRSGRSRAYVPYVKPRTKGLAQYKLIELSIRGTNPQLMHLHKWKCLQVELEDIYTFYNLGESRATIRVTI